MIIDITIFIVFEEHRKVNLWPALFSQIDQQKASINFREIMRKKTPSSLSVEEGRKLILLYFFSSDSLTLWESVVFDWSHCLTRGVSLTHAQIESKCRWDQHRINRTCTQAFIPLSQSVKWMLHRLSFQQVDLLKGFDFFRVVWASSQQRPLSRRSLSLLNKV